MARLRVNPRNCCDCGKPLKYTGSRCVRCTRIKHNVKYSPKVWHPQEEMDLLRDVCRQDFWTYFLYAFGAGLNPKGEAWIEPSIHYPMAQWYQNHILEWMEWRKRGIKRRKYLAALIHREVGKTTLFTRAGQSWLHVLDPEMSTFTGAEKPELSMKMLRAIKATLDGSDPSSLFTRLYGNWETGTSTWAGKEIVHAARKNTSRQDPSMGIFGVETSIVGAHPDAIFLDDPISRERVGQDTEWFAKVMEQVNGFDPILQADGLLFFAGTRYSTEDHFGTSFQYDGIASITGMQTDSLEVTPDGLWHVYFMCGRDSEGKATTPKVWPDERMNRLQRNDPVFYSTQVMNDPLISEDNPITKDQIKQCMVKKEDVPWSSLVFVICCDTAFWKGDKLKASKDHTVLVVHGLHKNGSGDVYIVEVQGSPSWRAEDFTRRLVTTVQRYRHQGKRIIGITDELYPSGGKTGSWASLLRGKFHDANEPMPPYYEFKRFGSSKIDRIVNAANFWVDGHVRWVEAAPGVSPLLDQMAQIGQMKLNKQMHDDYVDAHADVFHPQVYQPMRRQPKRVGPWDRGATPIQAEGFNPSDFLDYSQENESPRPPSR